MIDRVNELRRRQGKDADNSSFDAEIAKITQQRNAALKASEDEFETYESNIHSAVAGMKEAWKNYGEKVDDIAAQQSQVWSKSLDLMTDDLTDFLKTGTADFEKFFKNIAVMEEKYMVQSWLVRPFNDYIGGLMGGQPHQVQQRHRQIPLPFQIFLDSALRVVVWVQQRQ